MSKRGLGSDSLAMRKLDTMYEKIDPYEKEVGGSAYVAKERRQNSISSLYETDATAGKKEASKNLVSIIIASVACIAIIVAVVIVGLM